MYVPTTFAAALVMTIISTICWGSFANTLKLTKNYRFELYYWDYAFGIVLIALLLGHTMGAVGDNLHATTWTNLGYAALGGFILNIGNVLLIAGVEIVGLAVAFPISVGIALVEGVVLSYAIQHKGSAALLGAGVAMAVLAVVLVGRAYGALAPGQTRSRKGWVVCVVSGVLLGAFAPLITRAMTADRPLSPYSAALALTLGMLACCFVFNLYLMKHPLVGEPIGFAGYRSAPLSYHALGLLGGIVWGVGTVFNFVAASLVGVAISYAIGQASPMIAALWGVLVWKEFRGANARAKGYLAAMFIAYVLALVLIARAYQAA